MKYHVEYSANNSGGGWWLSDEDWHDLKDAGWNVMWVKDDLALSRPDGRWLGAIAEYACVDIEAESSGEALDVAASRFGSITGQDPDAEGCNCCGRPHYFYAYDDPEKCMHTTFVTANAI